MCVRIDFDKDAITPPRSPQPDIKRADAIDLLIERSTIGQAWQVGQEYASRARSPIHGLNEGEAALDDPEYDAEDDPQDY